MTDHLYEDGPRDGPLPTFANARMPTRYLRVCLDGVEQHYVSESDTTAGYIIRYKQVDGDWVPERVEGVVTHAWRTLDEQKVWDTELVRKAPLN